MVAGPSPIDISIRTVSFSTRSGHQLVFSAERPPNKSPKFVAADKDAHTYTRSSSPTLFQRLGPGKEISKLPPCPRPRSTSE
ncbi:hypothetical protein Trydic_g1459 [Trypoxylus dichotomus]